MIQYTVVCSEVLESFEEEVSRRLNAGWQCVGGVAVRATESQDAKGYDCSWRMYYQAMTRTIE